jgi:hypothetical protein
MAETLPGANHNQSDKDEGRDAGYACREGIPIGHLHALPHERSFSSKISDQLDRDCEPANNFRALWKVRSWRRLADGRGWRSAFGPKADDITQVWQDRLCRFAVAAAAKVQGAISGSRTFPNLQDCEVLHSRQSWSGGQCGLKGFSHDRIRKAPHNGRRGHPDGWSGHPHCAGLLGRAVTENHGYAIQAIRYSSRAACMN